MGLPADWKRVWHWLDYGGPIFFDEKPSNIENDRKWPNIPILEKYDGSGNSSFWAEFPRSDLPSSPVTQIDIEALEAKIDKVKHNLTAGQIQRAARAVDYLKNGAPSCQTENLGFCYVKNSNNTLLHGAVVTDHIATWIDKEYAAGPFTDPPFDNFRVNPLLAVIQPTKIRPVLNVSMPNGASFNSNVNKSELEKVKMSSAREFGEVLHECGPGATMSKFDLVAAYKQVPCKIEDLRLQGFMWNGKYFCETCQVFGASTSVSNFDVIGETIALSESEIPAK